MYIIPNEDYNYQYTIVVNYVTHDSFGKATIIHGFIFSTKMSTSVRVVLAGWGQGYRGGNK